MTTEAKTHAVKSNQRSGVSWSLTVLLGVGALAIALILHAPTAALAAGSVLTEPAAKVHHTTAVLNGHLDPEGDPGITECHFEWGETVVYGNTSPCMEGNTFSAPAGVSANLSGLNPDVTYHFRLKVETTSNGTITGADQSFTTIPVPTEHPVVASFGKDGTSGSNFVVPLKTHAAAPAIDQATKNLFALEWGNATGQLYGFDASAPPTFPLLGGFPYETPGNYLAWAIPIVASKGKVYFGTVNNSQNPAKFELNGISASGTELSGFPIDVKVNPGPPLIDKNTPQPHIEGIAIDSAGDIWISLEGVDSILRYSSAGLFQGSIDISTQSGRVGRLVFDSGDNLYVSFTQTGSSSGSSIRKFTANSGYTTAIDLPTPSATVAGLAVDASTEHLYASITSGSITSDIVAVYDLSSGELFDEFEVESSRGISVDPADHHTYIGGDQIEVYATGAPLSPPTTTTAPASPITGNKATLNGYVDPEGLAVTECKFEYGKGTFYGQIAPCSFNPGSGSGDVAVSAEISSLTPNTTYHYRLVAANSSTSDKGEDETFTTNPPPVVSSPAVENLTFKSAELKALVNPKGYETTYRFEYGTTTSYGIKVPVPDGNAGSGKGDVPVSVKISGLSSDTVYHWRLVAENANGEVVLADQTFTTFGPVKAETTGSPIRTTTTAQLQARINPDGAPTTYRFEYGTEGPCDSSPCLATPDRSAGAGGVYRFVAEEVEGLEPDTTYHYRVIAESPTPGGPAIGKDMTVTTRASDAPLSHGQFPGPPGSDRAYEQVSLPDTGGSPVFNAAAVSDDGNRAFYSVRGGTPISATGTLLSMVFAQRMPNGWHSEDVNPPRHELAGGAWLEPGGKHDLTDQIAMNVSSTGGGTALWRLRPGSPPTKVFSAGPGVPMGPVMVSEDASRVLVRMQGSQDPAHPAPPGRVNVYDVSSSAPQLISLLPDDSVSNCDVVAGLGATAEFAPSYKHWISPDSSLAFFQSCENLYMRDFSSEESTLIGPGVFLKWTPRGPFFVSDQSLVPGDIGGNDIYRYVPGDGSKECVTCVVPGRRANVSEVDAAVAEDGSRAYFSSSTELIRGATSPGIYRVDIPSGDFVYVAPITPGDDVSDNPNRGNALTPDGSVFVFSSSNSVLNAFGGQQNGDTQQFYRYDDQDRSLTCLSCPQDGSAPENSLGQEGLVTDSLFRIGANRTALSADGRIFAFSTDEPLLPGDQNTARPGQRPSVGGDLYEWRDGRLLLVSDGLGEWTDVGGGAEVSAITPSGSDIFFTAFAQYTPDALDDSRRLYSARLGGGFVFPSQSEPCPLEVCQGTPKGVPVEQTPGTGDFSGPSNVIPHPVQRPCPKGRRKVSRGGSVRCVKRQSKRSRNHRRANSSRKEQQ